MSIFVSNSNSMMTLRFSQAFSESELLLIAQVFRVLVIKEKGSLFFLKISHIQKFNFKE
jgi:hypothetical protein